jgi:hypothetical protein
MSIQRSLSEAIKAHVEWLIALIDMIDERHLPHVDPENIRSIDSCKIGIWLRDMEADFGYLEEYVQAHVLHRDFHVHAGDIVEYCKIGNREEAMQQIHRLSGVDGASDKMIHALASLLDRLHLMGVEDHRLRIALSCAPVFQAL